MFLCVELFQNRANYIQYNQFGTQRQFTEKSSPVLDTLYVHFILCVLVEYTITLLHLFRIFVSVHIQKDIILYRYS